MIHLTIQQLSSFLDAEANESSRSVVQDHLAVCDTCSGKFARLKHQEELLVKALSSDPGDAFFEEFHRSLAERVTPRPSKGDLAPATTPAAVGARAVVPGRAAVQAARPVTAARTVAATRPVAAARPVTAREILGDRDAAGRERSDDFARPTPARAKKSGFGWGAAVTVFVIVGSIGAVNFGAEYATRWLGTSHSGDVRQQNGPGPVVATAGDGSFASPGSVPVTGASPAPAATAPTAPATDVAGTRPESTPSAPPSRQAPFPSSSPPKASAPADDAGDSGPAWKPDSDEATESTTPDDEEPASAAKYDAIGMAIERSLPMLQGDDYREARFKLAEARYNAWSLEPNGARSAVVLRAIRAYLIGAPAGTERDTATGWLSEVESAGY